MNSKAGGPTPELLRVFSTLQIWSPKRARITRSSNMQQKQASMPEVFETGEVQDVIVRRLQRYDDSRGWLTELFRNDDLPAEFQPVMAYISSTRAGITRGP